MNDPVTIAIERSTRKKLKGLGKKDETYDKIINRLIEVFENKGELNE